MSMAFPIPAANQEPEDDMHRAMALLRLVSAIVSEGAAGRGLGFDDLSDIEIALSMATDELKPIQHYLELETCNLERYRECRRAEILKWGGQR